MKQYLLSIYQPDSDPPPADVLAEIMRDVRAVDEELGSCKGLRCLIHTVVPGLHTHPGWFRGWR